MSNEDLSKVARNLFDPAESIRLEAFKLLEKNWASDQSTVDELLKQASANKTNKEGVLLFLQYLKRRDIGLLAKNREELSRLLDEVRGNGPRTGRQVTKLLDRLALLDSTQ